VWCTEEEEGTEAGRPGLLTGAMHALCSANTVTVRSIVVCAVCHCARCVLLCVL
jgi:hypothetical protein